ncbi:stage II sporulation protein P [Paenibacillus sp. R14(2021)]|uniref:stage II sporulation protein P n=1 Tax=Paenibacillus sp. R14(2021) TaxID=2859228 RepID=UPI001C612112|nr:stage II sporulation protein P [Paenibacillus sp. R14(2021)]
MKRTFITLNIGRSSIRLRQLLVTGRTFALLSLGSMVLVLVVGIGVIVQQKASTSPMSTMKGFAASVSGGLFSDMLAMEMPGTAKADTKSSITGRQISSFLIRLLTDINPDDPKSLLASQYAGLYSDTFTLIRPGSGTDALVEPEDQEPLPDNGHETADNVSDSDRPDHDPGDIGAITEDEPSEDTDAPNDSGDNDPKPSANDQGGPALPSTSGRKVVFIYHSHIRESWFPELSSRKTPESKVKNISLVGKRLSVQLNKLGVGALQSSTDYPSTIKNYNWLLSYKYSKKTVVDAMADNQGLKFFFDIHRDSSERKNTTVTIGGEDYAKIMFIVGQANPDWKKNEAFASEIHDELEKSYPGISRIWGKTTASGNGEYNQSLAPDSVLIEIGGKDNTLKESYRTADVLAKVIADIYWKAEKVSAPNTK